MGLSSGVMASLEHVHQTSQWYTELLQNYEASLGGDKLAVNCGRLITLYTQETWHDDLPVQAGEAEKMVHQFMREVFQPREAVVKKLEAIGRSVSSVRVPGTHFSMLHEPHVAFLALKMCSRLDEAGALEA